jgi:putative hydrolase of the HAD superfamily
MAEGGPGLPSSIDAVLLDAGGVLLDLDYGYLRRRVKARTAEVSVETLARAEAVARREMNRLEGKFAPDERWREYFHVLLNEVGVGEADREAIIDSLWEAHRRVGLWTVAVAGAVEAVDALKAGGLRVGVVSNAEGQVARDLDSAGFDGRFEIVVDSRLVGVQKPDPAIFGIALERMSLDPARCVFVGDLPAVDVDGAKAAGIAPILLDRHDLYPDVAAPRLGAIDGLPKLLLD